MIALSPSFNRWRYVLARLLFTPLKPLPRDASVPSDLSDHLKRDIGIADGGITTRAWF
ncbi:hypothetical protein [Labrys neptuniae]